MFTTIVGIGVGNILMRFASASADLRLADVRSFAAAWLVILLLSYLGMFWNASVLFSRESWTFALFLYAILGPILLLSAGSLMCELFAAEIESDHRGRLQTRFFVLFALVQAWMMGMDFLIGAGWTMDTTLSAVLGSISAALAVAGSERLRNVFTVVMLLAALVDAGLQSV